MICRSSIYYGLLCVFSSIRLLHAGDSAACYPSCAVPAEATCAVPSACAPSCAVPQGCSSSGSGCGSRVYQPQQVEQEHRCGGFLRRIRCCPLINLQKCEIEFHNREKCCTHNCNSPQSVSAPAYQAVPTQMMIQAYAIQPVAYAPVQSFAPVSYAPMSYTAAPAVSYAPQASHIPVPAARPRNTDCDCESILEAIAALRADLHELKSSLEGLEERTSENEAMIRKQDEISGYQTELLTRQDQDLNSLRKLLENH